jgi:hypothetical protein
MQSIEHKEGDYISYRNEKDRLHREDGPAKICVIGDRLGDEFWYLDGRDHRIGGPARNWISKFWETAGTYNYRHQWYRNGIKHRLNAHATIKYSGAKEYWIFGELYK